MMLSTKGRYAVMAMVELAVRGDESPICLAKIAECQEIPLPYLEQIFATLRREGLVKATRGPGGGYKLARAASDIRIFDIIVAMDESMRMTRCEHASPTGCMADKSRCLTHDLWEGLTDQIRRYLSGISLQDVLNRKTRHGAVAALFPEAAVHQEERYV
ncbi:MAG: Rrf2 family transcriptional regulator [Alphaproteobacteria bacterium]|nr:Rrf2 family transcriptional regulator [Alphaproteobacteria bacterium]